MASPSRRNGLLASGWADISDMSLGLSELEIGVKIRKSEHDSSRRSTVARRQRDRRSSRPAAQHPPSRGAILSSNSNPSVVWWDAYGGRDHELLKFARRVVSLCCSSSGCERNWSTFEFIHTKKRNRLEHKRLNDLVYVQYNKKIASRFKKRRELGKDFDPLVLEDLQWSNEWIDAEREAEETDSGIIDFTVILDDEFVDDHYGLINPSATEGDGIAQTDGDHDLELDDFA